MIVIGVLLALVGLIGTPLIQDLMPLTILSDSNTHSYIRVVSTSDEQLLYVPLMFIAAGVFCFVVGTIIRRKKAD